MSARVKANAAYCPTLEIASTRSSPVSAVNSDGVYRPHNQYFSFRRLASPLSPSFIRSGFTRSSMIASSSGQSAATGSG